MYFENMATTRMKELQEKSDRYQLEKAFSCCQEVRSVWGWLRSQFTRKETPVENSEFTPMFGYVCECYSSK